MIQHEKEFLNEFKKLVIILREFLLLQFSPFAWEEKQKVLKRLEE